MKIKEKIMVTRSSMPPLEEYIDEIRGLWDSHQLTNMGIEHKLFQEKLSQFLDTEKVELVVNGHMALELALQAMHLKGEVITTPFTFASTTHAIVRNGLKPVFCDISSDDYTIDVEMIESLITEDTCAIMPVHVYGNICDVKAIDEIAKKYDLKVLYDAAHAFAEKLDGISVARFGDASAYSFHATKVFNSIEGGCICSNDQDLINEIYNLKNFGIQGPESVVACGANAKMNEFCAAMGLCNLRHIEDEIEKRKRVYERYFENLDGITGGLKLNRIRRNVRSNYSYFPLVVENSYGVSRDEVYDLLNREGIVARKYFYPITSAFECYKKEFDPNTTPRAMEISQKIITLPIYSDLAIEDVDRICKIILCMKRQVL